MDIVQEFKDTYLEELQSILPEGMDVVIENKIIYIRVGEDVVNEVGLLKYHEIMGDEILHNKFFGALATQIEKLVFSEVTKGL